MKRPVMFAIALIGLLGAANAQISIDIREGNVDPLRIALPDFLGSDPDVRRTARDVTAVLTNDLERSGLFAPLDPNAFLDVAQGVEDTPDFADWRVLNAQALVTGGARIDDDGQLVIEFRLWDVFAGRQLVGRRFATTPENWRRVAHLTADAIYERLTGEVGYFDTRVVYVAETGPKTARIKRLAIMDQDGANPSYLTDGGATVLTPRFSPSRQQLTYLSYASGTPQVYLYNLGSGQQEILGRFPGMTFAPRFSPDGESVVMSLARNGNSDVYVMELGRRAMRRLTYAPAIDTSPSMSPQGRFVTFSSDRSGTPQIYVMNAEGGDMRRITFGDGRYHTPVWSPRGDLIAFTRQFRDRFYIGVIRPDGLDERLLTESWLDEGPSWSPNGRVIMFCRQYPSDDPFNPNGAALFSVDLTGYNLRRVQTPGNACDPAWSPLIR